MQRKTRRPLANAAAAVVAGSLAASNLEANIPSSSIPKPKDILESIKFHASMPSTPTESRYVTPGVEKIEQLKSPVEYGLVPKASPVFEKKTKLAHQLWMFDKNTPLIPTVVGIGEVRHEHEYSYAITTSRGGETLAVILVGDRSIIMQVAPNSGLCIPYLFDSVASEVGDGQSHSIGVKNPERGFSLIGLALSRQKDGTVKAFMGRGDLEGMVITSYMLQLPKPKAK